MINALVSFISNKFVNNFGEIISKMLALSIKKVFLNDNQ